MLPLAGQPSLHGLRRHLGEIAGKLCVRVFLFSRNSSYQWWGRVLWLFGLVGQDILVLSPVSLLLRFSMQGGGSLMVILFWRLKVDFVAVVEHRLTPARVRGEWTRLRGKGLTTIWAPASQESSHAGNAGVGVISMRCASLSLPTFAIAQFKRFFDSGRAIRCMLTMDAVRFMHLVVLYGYQGADTDAGQLALTEQLFDAALGELGVVARGQPCLIVGDFNVEPTKIPCLAKGILAGLWVDLESAWASACGRDFTVGCTLAAAAVTSCVVEPDRWIVPHLAVRTHFECTRWTCRVTQPVQRTPLWSASWIPAVNKSRGSKSAEV